ncbi:MAG TPA: Swt1 family HEPN domain-containing protein [Candidatus Microsaccharimonas sp.]
MSLRINKPDLRNWLFKGLSVESRLDELEVEGVSVRAATDPGALQRIMPLENFSSTIRKAAMRSLPAYMAFFCLENAIRELVTDRMLELHGNKWWEEKVSTSTKRKVETRRAKEGDNRWHVQRGASEIFYTDFGDLSTIIQSNWADFEDLFPDMQWVASRLSDLESSRNVIAHMNTLDDREIDRITLYLEDWTKQLG